MEQLVALFWVSRLGWGSFGVGRKGVRMPDHFWCEKARFALSAEQSPHICCVGCFCAVPTLQERCLDWCVESLGFSGLGKLFQAVLLPGLWFECFDHTCGPRQPGARIAKSVHACMDPLMLHGCILT